MAGTYDRRRLTLAGDHDRNVVAIALNTAELDLVRRAVRQLALREGESRRSENVLQMLESPPYLAELRRLAETVNY